MKPFGIVITASLLSLIQAYAAYLLHNDMIKWELLQWGISVFYLPLYFILLVLGALLESLLGLHLLKGGVAFPYLNDAMWIIGAIILLPINGWWLKRLSRCQQRA